MILAQNVPLQTYNSFGIAARADYLVRVRDEADLQAVLRDARLAHLPRTVLGGGSNVVLTGDVRGLVRVSRLDQPEASLLAPDQSYFVRENLKLRLLNARLGLLARQHEAARADLTAVQRDLAKYFDVQSRKGQLALGLLKQVQNEMQQVELPRIDDTLAALTTAAAGR